MTGRNHGWMLIFLVSLQQASSSPELRKQIRGMTVLGISAFICVHLWFFIVLNHQDTKAQRAGTKAHGVFAFFAPSRFKKFSPLRPRRTQRYRGMTKLVVIAVRVVVFYLMTENQTLSKTNRCKKATVGRKLWRGCNKSP